MELSQVTFFTEDVSGTARFYEHLFDAEPSLSEESIAIFDLGGVEVIIHETYEAGGDGIPPEDYAAFAVENLDERFSELLDDGFEPFREPADYDWGRSAYLRDPDGRLVELSEK
jgi:catechol 2,3-dioxygenase-like lactoylglutathione lyase family enzyme